MTLVTVEDLTWLVRTTIIVAKPTIQVIYSVCVGGKNKQKYICMIISDTHVQLYDYCATVGVEIM